MMPTWPKLPSVVPKTSHFNYFQFCKYVFSLKDKSFFNLFHQIANIYKIWLINLLINFSLVDQYKCLRKQCRSR